MKLFYLDSINARRGKVFASLRTYALSGNRLVAGVVLVLAVTPLGLNVVSDAYIHLIELSDAHLD